MLSIYNDDDTQSIIIDQLQLADSGIYVIFVFNPGEAAGEYDLGFRIGDAGP